MIIMSLFLNQLALAAKNLILQIEGINGPEKNNVEAILKNSIILSNVSSNLNQFRQNALTKIQTALQPFGYFKPKIETDFKKNHQQWVIHFRIDPGPILLVTNLDFELVGSGINDPIFQEILLNLPLAKNKAFSAEKYNLTKDKLINGALQNGYFDARFEQAQIKIDLQKYQATIILHFNTGQRYLFGPIHFNSNLYSTRFLQRFAPFSLGEKFDSEKLQKLEENLLTGNYFKRVNIDPKINNAQEFLIPIEVTLSPLPQKEYNLGVGYGTNTGPRVLFNHISRGIINGQLFQADIQASQVYNHVEANYIIPGKKPATDKYMLGGAVQQIDIPYGKSYLEKASISYSNSLYGLQQIFSLILQNENWALTDQSYQSAVLIIPNINWNKTYKNDNIRPTKGFRFNLALLGAPVFSPNTFLQAKLNAKAIYPIFDIGFLLARGELGYTVVKNTQQLPLSLNFFAGGTESIRGFDYNSIGPGTNLLTASIEYRQKIKTEWYLAGFVDIGNASNSFPGQLQTGVGLGPVFQSPVGTIELTLARGLGSQGKSWLIQFNMGPEL